MFVQVHMLQSVPPGNLNRDDTGQPKKCIFGGVTRGRISSQCLKRNIRHSHEFREAFGDALADRTKYLPRMVADELKRSRERLGVPDEELNDLMVALASKFKKENGGDSDHGDNGSDEQGATNAPAFADDEVGQTGQLVFFPQPFAVRIAELVAGLRKERPVAYRYFLTGETMPETEEEEANFKARKAELRTRKAQLKKDEKVADTDEKKAALAKKKAALAEDEKSFKAEAESKKGALNSAIGEFIRSVAAASKSLTVDIALFGRMTTSDLVVNVEAACQVAHAIGTHETIIESDYFTAMDDKKMEFAPTQTEQAGAAFLGSGETETFFNSAVYYKYLNLDTDALQKHLPSLTCENVARVVGVLVSAAARANPTGKQNSFASHGVHELILVEWSKTKRPISYANAFLQPVEGGVGRNLMTESAHALKDYVDSVAGAFAPADLRRVLLAVGRASIDLEGAQRAATLDKLVESVVAAIGSPQKAG